MVSYQSPSSIEAGSGHFIDMYQLPPEFAW